MATHGGSSSSPPPPPHENPIVEDDVNLMMYGAESGWVEARTSCDHLPSLSSDLLHIPTLDTRCNRLSNGKKTCTSMLASSNSLSFDINQYASTRMRTGYACASCKEVLCSRFVNKHMLQHYQQIHHCLALSYSDLSVWCFSCDAYLDAHLIPQLRPVYETAYLLKFGEAPPVRTA